MGEVICIKYKQKRELTRKLQITLKNKKERDSAAGIWAEDTSRKFTEEANIMGSKKTKIMINLSSYQGNVLKTITPHWQKVKVRRERWVRM